MKRRILLADTDERLQHAFSTIFSKEDYEILYASNGKEAEKLADRMKPEVYIINVNLPKINGIELYKRFQKQKLLDTATFFFLKDENDRTELLGYQAAGVIEKPVNFFRVYETITKEDEVIELTDAVEEEREAPRARTRAALDEFESPFAPSQTRPRTTEQRPLDEERLPREPAAEEPPRGVEAELGARLRQREAVAEEAARGVEAELGARLRDAMGSAMTAVSNEEGPGAPALEEQFRSAIAQVMEQASKELAARLAPVLSAYVEESVKRILLEVAEKVIREEIDKLLKESGT